MLRHYAIAATIADESDAADMRQRYADGERRARRQKERAYVDGGTYAMIF